MKHLLRLYALAALLLAGLAGAAPPPARMQSLPPGPLVGPAITVPETVTAPGPGLVVIRPSLLTGHAHWSSLDGGLQLLPADVATVPRGSCVAFAVKPGTYRLQVRVTAHGQGTTTVSDPLTVTVVVGAGPVPPAMPPAPAPTVPPVVPPTKPTGDVSTQVVQALEAMERRLTARIDNRLDAVESRVRALEVASRLDVARQPAPVPTPDRRENPANPASRAAKTAPTVPTSLSDPDGTAALAEKWRLRREAAEGPPKARQGTTAPQKVSALTPADSGYHDAYRRALRENKPLVVWVGGEFCPT